MTQSQTGATPPPEPTGDAAHMAALLAARHDDPFGWLGMHETPEGLVVRAFLPWAHSVQLIDNVSGQSLGEMLRSHPDGIWSIELPGRNDRFAYRFQVQGDLDPVTLEDPYRFGPQLGELDRHLIGEGNHLRLWEKLGAHPITVDGVDGTCFAVWAPNARRVSVVGNFNGWDGRQHPMRRHPGSGIWEIFMPGVGRGEVYKYELLGADGNLLPLKADPMALFAEKPPATASMVQGLSDYAWTDHDWMTRRAETVDRGAPISIYEVHMGSWRRKPEEAYRSLTYREMAAEMVPYVAEMGFTHIELLPVSEFPYDGSWGYQPVGLFAVTSRYGSPDDFRYFVDQCHAHGIGVIMDWVVGHFPEDAHGMVWFDGTHLYEHADPRQGRHQDWGTLIYNYGRNEVANFLLANAMFWMDYYHIDGLRVDAVASMLYLNYSREDGEWLPNQYGGNENLEAIAFLRRLNELVYGNYPGAFTIAEESTAWPMVSRPTWLGGLGFGYKWNMGWMHDTLDYIGHDPIHRRYHHSGLTFGLLYAFHENFVLPISHDEVVHGKGSLLGRMPGDRWQRFANMRAYLAFMFTHPGKKLLFMGCEFAQEREWNYEESLDWHLLEQPEHRKIQALVAALNRLYTEQPALARHDCEGQGFEWVDCNDADQSTLSFLRKGDEGDPLVVVVFNFTPMVRHGFRVGLPAGGAWQVALNTDAAEWGGSGVDNGSALHAQEGDWHGRPFHADMTLPPLGAVVLVQGDAP